MVARNVLPDRFMSTARISMLVSGIFLLMQATFAGAQLVAYEYSDDEMSVEYDIAAPVATGTEASSGQMRRARLAASGFEAPEGEAPANDVLTRGAVEFIAADSGVVMRVPAGVGRGRPRQLSPRELRWEENVAPDQPELPVDLGVTWELATPLEDRTVQPDHPPSLDETIETFEVEMPVEETTEMVSVQPELPVTLDVTFEVVEYEIPIEEVTEVAPIPLDRPVDLDEVTDMAEGEMPMEEVSPAEKAESVAPDIDVARRVPAGLGRARPDESLSLELSAEEEVAAVPQYSPAVVDVRVETPSIKTETVASDSTVVRRVPAGVGPERPAERHSRGVRGEVEVGPGRPYLPATSGGKVMLVFAPEQRMQPGMPPSFGAFLDHLAEKKRQMDVGDDSAQETENNFEEPEKRRTAADEYHGPGYRRLSGVAVDERPPLDRGNPVFPRPGEKDTLLERVFLYFPDANEWSHRPGVIVDPKKSEFFTTPESMRQRSSAIYRQTP